MGELEPHAGTVGGRALMRIFLALASSPNPTFASDLWKWNLHDPLVEMHRRVEAARVYTREVARRYDAGEQPLVEALHAKKLGVDTASYCTDEAVQIHGGMGYSRELPVERYFRDAKITEIYEGTSEIQRLVISRSELGLK